MNTWSDKVLADGAAPHRPFFAAAEATRMGGSMAPQLVPTATDLTYENACRERRHEVARRNPDWQREEWERIQAQKFGRYGLVQSSAHDQPLFKRSEWSSHQHQFQSERARADDEVPSAAVPAEHFDVYQTMPRLFMGGARAWQVHLADD